MTVKLFVHRWDNAPITFRIPDDLARLLDSFLQKGHKVISPDSKYVFSNMRGQHFVEAASITHYWGKVSKKIGLPASIPPTRSAFLAITVFLMGGTLSN